VISELENIDDECDMFGIQMVKLKDPQLAKRYRLPIRDIVTELLTW
jgi:hypothetical protein